MDPDQATYQWRRTLNTRDPDLVGRVQVVSTKCEWDVAVPPLVQEALESKIIFYDSEGDTLATGWPAVLSVVVPSVDPILGNARNRLVLFRIQALTRAGIFTEEGFPDEFKVLFMDEAIQKVSLCPEKTMFRLARLGCTNPGLAVDVRELMQAHHDLHLLTNYAQDNPNRKTDVWRLEAVAFEWPYKIPVSSNVDEILYTYGSWNQPSSLPEAMVREGMRRSLVAAGYFAFVVEQEVRDKALGKGLIIDWMANYARLKAKTIQFPPEGYCRMLIENEKALKEHPETYRAFRDATYDHRSYGPDEVLPKERACEASRSLLFPPFGVDHLPNLLDRTSSASSR